ncbi:hypothetical protein PHISP_00761 [Aspergillus sp. HF37]|nr:hypothetical protein PHISP_00761 [Aspergillus sp. HF37]
MSPQSKRSANGSMASRNGVKKITASSGQPRVARQHSAAADDPRNFTAPHPEQVHWSVDNLPSILYQLRAVETGIPEQRVGMKDDVLYGKRVRDLPALPDHISSNVEEWRVEAWMRLDKRIRLGDITDRMHPEFRISNNTLQQRNGRFRQDFHLISWYSGNRKSAEIEAKVVQKLIENNIDPALNTTRGLTPGLINPEMGEAGGRVPLPANWSGLKITRPRERRAATPPQTAQRVRNTAPQNMTPAVGHRRDDSSGTAEILTPVSNPSPVENLRTSQQIANPAPVTPATSQQNVTNPTTPLIDNTISPANGQQEVTPMNNGIMPLDDLHRRLEQAIEHHDPQTEDRVDHHARPDMGTVQQLPSPESSADTKSIVDAYQQELERTRMPLDILQNLAAQSHIPLPLNLDPVDRDFMAQQAAIGEYASDPYAFPYGYYDLHPTERPPSSHLFDDAATMAKQATIIQFAQESRNHKALAPRENESLYFVEGGVSLRGIQNASPPPSKKGADGGGFFMSWESPAPSGMGTPASSSMSDATGSTFSSAGSSDMEEEVDFSEWLNL